MSPQTLSVILALCALQISASEVTPRIVGGKNAVLGQAPYQCSLETKMLLMRRHFCGCAIMNDEWIVTAAHCVSGMTTGIVKVLVGTINLKKGGDIYTVRSIHGHKSFNVPKFAHDIALIRLNEKISFNENVQPIALRREEVDPKSNLQLTGWGLLEAHGELPKLLQVVNLTSISNDNCKSASHASNQVHEGHLCTSNGEGIGACHGDSGGPLTFNGQLVGIVNWGLPCARGSPDAFASIAYYYDWIQKTVEDATSSQ